MENDETAVDYAKYQEMQEAINFSLGLFAERDRREEWRAVEAQVRRKQYNELDAEQVIERIYGVYGKLGEGLNRFAEGLGESSVVSWFQNIDESLARKETLDEDMFMTFFLRDGDEDYLVDYRSEADCAFDRLLDLGVEAGNVDQAVGLITSLKDPILASRFLQVVRNNPDVNIALENSGQRQHLQHSRRELLSDRTGMARALLIGLRVARLARHVAQVTEKDVLQPLRDITIYPEVPCQVLKEALHGRQLEATS